MEEDINPAEADTSDASESYEEAGADDSGTLTFVEAINRATGRDYKTDEEALKGVSETAKYVGKVGKYKDVLSAVEAAYGGESKAIEALQGLTKKEQKALEQAQPDLAKEVENLKADLWFKENPDYAAHRKLISALKQPGQSYEDVINSDEYRGTFETLKGKQPETTKSIIHTNARIADSGTDYQKDLQKAKETGDWAGFIAKHKGVGIKE